MLHCEAETADALLVALAEFSHYEGELRRIEAEVAHTWDELEQDSPLAFEVAPADLKRTSEVGQRMGRILQHRICAARMEQHLYEATPAIAGTAQKLAEELRERARIEQRMEALDTQLEVAEGVYEMAAQRIGEFTAAHEGQRIEWIIIVLLGAEAILMLFDVLMKHHH